MLTTWIASFPKSGNTWVRLYLMNLLVEQSEPLTLARLSELPLVDDVTAHIRGDGPFGKTHRHHNPITHGPRSRAIYIVRDPVDVVASSAAYFGVTNDRMSREVAKDWPRHVESWLGEDGAGCRFYRYEDMPGCFHRLTKDLGIAATFGDRVEAMHACGFAKVAADEAENGFSEANKRVKTPFFRHGKPGNGREVLTERQIARVIDGAGDWYDFFAYGEG